MATADIDLTVNASSGSIGGAVFTTGQTGAGTGIFDTFVQLQHNGTEQGYNTDARGQYDEKPSTRRPCSPTVARRRAGSRPSP